MRVQTAGLYVTSVHDVHVQGHLNKSSPGFQSTRSSNFGRVITTGRWSMSLARCYFAWPVAILALAVIHRYVLSATLTQKCISGDGLMSLPPHHITSLQFACTRHLYDAGKHPIPTHALHCSPSPLLSIPLTKSNHAKAWFINTSQGKVLGLPSFIKAKWKERSFILSLCPVSVIYCIWLMVYSFAAKRSRAHFLTSYYTNIETTTVRTGSLLTS